ncbi:MAG: cupin [Candidatus Pacebacteria bacterium CG10_big_fil_rev_8_21_14_0_10_42_12]|nr:MAG: cupin [Candidatus Pacebacteria bacterium CG10_big_fil_rev_8_21_14_0_10_42_12]
MKIISQNQAIHVDKEEGTSVDYYLFPEYEVHYNEVKPGVVQLWHHHSNISETLFIIEGEIEAHWLNKASIKQNQLVKKGDLIEIENTPHTFINSSNGLARFIVFRFVPTGEDKSEIIKGDKVLDQHLQK